jgi:DNA adenine methylase
MVTTPTATAIKGSSLLSVTPLLRWCGSKYKAPIMQHIAEEYLLHSVMYPDSHYVAPFGGALGDLHYLMPGNAFIGDTNRSLIWLYEWIQSGTPNIESVIWESASGDPAYYKIRSRYNAAMRLTGRFMDTMGLDVCEFSIIQEHHFGSELIRVGNVILGLPDARFQAALAYEQGCNGSSEASHDENTLAEFFALLEAQMSADLIWLNRTTFNGLYRVNANGDFNSPMGRNGDGSPKNPGILDLAEHVELYQRWSFTCCDYKHIGDEFTDMFAEEFTGQFIYCDPLYVGSDKIYAVGEMDYVALADKMLEWSRMGNTVATSNHHTPEMESILRSRGFTIIETTYKQSVSTDAKTRGNTKELFAVIRSD